MKYDIIALNLERLTKQNTSYKRANIFFKSALIALFTIIFLKIIFSLCSDMFREMFYLFPCFTFAELNCFCAPPSPMCLLPNTL